MFKLSHLASNLFLRQLEPILSNALHLQAVEFYAFRRLEKTQASAVLRKYPIRVSFPFYKGYLDWAPCCESCTSAFTKKQPMEYVARLRISLATEHQ